MAKVGKKYCEYKWLSAQWGLVGSFGVLPVGVLNALFWHRLAGESLYVQSVTVLDAILA
jgi:hypothetical protein